MPFTEYIFQQDSTPAPKAQDTVELLQRDTPDFIPLYLCPPKSPYLSQVNYCVGILQVSAPNAYLKTD